jgi:DNA-binding MurR/RpiR family transcriptional regulator
MERTIVTFLSTEELEALIIKCLKQYDEMKLNTVSAVETLSINQVAKLLKRSHATVKRMAVEGTLKSTSDFRRISASSLHEYITNNPQK